MNRIGFARVSSLESHRTPITRQALCVLSLGILALLSCAAIILVQSQGSVSGDFWAWIVSIPAYFTILLVFPEAVPRPTSFRPIMWAGAIGAVILVAVPLLVLISGPSLGQLPALPSWASINGALLIQSAAFASFVTGSRIGQPSTARPAYPPRRTSLSVIAVLVVVGYFGALIRVGGLSNLTSYATFAGATPTSAGRWAIIGAFAPPMALTGGLLYWRRHRGRLTPRRLVVLLATVIPLMSYGYNRGAWLYPLICVLLTYSSLEGRIRLPAMLSLGAASVMLVQAWASWRGAAQLAPLGVQYQGGVTLSDSLQLYGSSPQLVAFAIDADPNVSTLLASVLSPIPLVGEAARPVSGPALFNNAVYGGSTADQILPAVAELWWIAGLVAVIVGFLIAGSVVGRLERLWGYDADPVRRTYALLFGLWVSLLLLWSFSVVAQLFIYFGVLPWVFLRLTRRF